MRVPVGRYLTDEVPALACIQVKLCDGIIASDKHLNLLMVTWVTGDILGSSWQPRTW